MLRNTKWVYGVVIYAGHDTKLMMNTGMMFTYSVPITYFIISKLYIILIGFNTANCSSLT